MNVTGILHVNINCSDFERSRRFYEMLGFRVIMDVEPNGGAEVAAAVGMAPYVVRGALMKPRDGSVIEPLEWRLPRRTTRFICFRDPDGTVLELVEMGSG